MSRVLNLLYNHEFFRAALGVTVALSWRCYGDAVSWH